MRDIIQVLNAFPPVHGEEERLEQLIEGIQLASFALANHFKMRHEEITVQAVNSDGGSLCVIFPDKIYGSTFRIDDSTYPGNAVLSGKPLIKNEKINPNSLPLYEKLNASKSKPIQKLAIIPIIASNRVYGVLQLTRRANAPHEAGKDLKEIDLFFIRPLLTALGQLIENFRPENF